MSATNEVTQAASLADAVLDAEAERQAATADKEVLFADDLLPGVGDEELTLRQGLAAGGSYTFMVLLLLACVENFEGATLGVLAPDIRDTFGVSDGVIVFISSASAAFLVLGALPMGWLADRYRRPPIIAIASAAFGVFVFCSGMAVNAFTLFLARFGVGMAKSSTITVHSSLIADTYPIGVRGRISASTMGSGLVIAAMSPALVGGIAALAGGPEGWRWTFIILGIPSVVLAVLALRVPEAPRGQYEMKDVLGEVIDVRPTPMSMESAFARLKQVRTVHTAMLAFAAIGFGLFTTPILQNLYIEERFDLDALERGLLGSFGGLFVVAILPFAARGYDARFRSDPARALRLVGLMLLPIVVLVPIQYAMPSSILFAIVGVAPQILLMTVFTMVGPILQSVVPYRLRGMGVVLGSLYIFFVGATGGAVLSAFFVNVTGPRAAVLLLTVPSTLVGGLLLIRGSMLIKSDLSMVVAELREEMEEHKRQQANPDEIPALQVNDIDFSYGHVQVLFDVGFEVRKGEVLALLGTNGAGKSTILRVIAGLGTPARGVVRLNGLNITYVSPEKRGGMGIRLLPGGKGVFPQMSVRENLEMAAFVFRSDEADQERRIAKVLDLFEDLAGRQGQSAASLSGGQQQMLALACVLLHEPDILLIDELSLGLSPIMVQQLLGVVEQLKQQGITIVIVEQSLNVALAMADRAVFLEKGQVRFEGTARDLLERDDLARAVFLGSEGADLVLDGLFTRQLLFDGLITGMVFGLVAMGIVLVYRSTRVINFAVANIGFLGAGVFALLVAQWNMPFWLSAVLGIALGIVFGAVIELVVIRRLFSAPRVIVLVATIGIAQLCLAILTALPEIDAPGARFPLPIGSVNEVAGIRVVGPQLSILITVPLIALGLGWLLNRTALGKAVKASAENPDLARLYGISPKAVSTAVWALAGGLATVSLALLAGQSGSAQNLDNLGPSTLTRALAAAVIAGMVSFPRAFVAGIVIGIVQSVVSFNFLDQPGLMDFLILLAVVVAVYWQSRQRGETQTFAFGAKAKPVPERLRQVFWIRQIDKIGLVLLGIGAVILPLLVTQPSKHLLYTSILAFAICALSLTVLTGWAGQLSLGQMAFAGVGALLTAAFVRGINFDIGWHDTRIIKAGIEPLRYGPAVCFSVLITAGLAVLIGAGALRVRGLYLAVVTFAFALAATQYLYDRPILSGGFTDSVPLRRTDFFGINITSQRSFYFLTLALLGLSIVVVARLRASGVGRTTIAVRDNPDTAAAYTVSNSRTKLRAFALAGGLAALGGSLIAANVQSVPSDRYFTVADSLLVVSIVVIGGLGSVAGTLLGAIWVIGLPAFFPDNDLVPLLTSSVGLLVLLLYFPGGLMQVGYGLRQMIFDWAERRLGPAPPKQRHAVPARRAEEREPLPEGVPALRTTGVTVRFGGNLAVDAVSIEVREGEVVGLIGTNGAGKSTLMNAVGGFVPSSGSVELFGSSISGKSAAARARLGLGRSFQAATLFPELTVRDSVLVALEARGRTGIISTALFFPPAIKRERARRSEAEELIDFLGLGRYADNYIGDLSTGTRRIVELAGLLALDTRFLCLDEPTAGVAQRETEAFGPLILEVRRELGASMLVIEHDMPLIMSISDRVYCLDVGRLIAEGTPDAVRHDTAVVASYLGTDERAIARSGAVADVAAVDVVLDEV